MENIENIRSKAEDLLKNIQKIARESLRTGKKPELPEEIFNNIEDTINEVIDYPENAQLIGVLPQYRQEFKQFLRIALEKLAAELKRQNILEESIFNDKNKLRLLTEMLIINLEEIVFALAKKLPIPSKILENAKKVATYRDSEFIDKFLNSDEIISEYFNISIDEAKKLFPRSLKVRLIANNISNLFELLDRVKYHLEHTLTDDNIINIAVEEGFTRKEAESLKTDPIYKDLFTRGYKVSLILRYRDPSEGVKKFLRGEI